MGVTDWILLGAILLCAGAAVAHILRGKKRLLRRLPRLQRMRKKVIQNLRFRRRF